MNFAPLYLLAWLAAFIAALLALPFCRWWSLRLGLVDDPGVRKVHQHSVPLAGGMAVLIALSLPTLFGLLALGCGWTFLDSSSSEILLRSLKENGAELLVVCLGAGGMFILGLWDDRFELRPRQKFAGQLLVSLLVALGGIRITLFVPSPLFGCAITVLWILTVVNAFNFVDNMNGLGAGLGALGAAWFFILCATSGQVFAAVLASLICGALLGFLPYNFPRARVFLGDSGSHLVGYLLAILAVMPDFYSPGNPRVFAVLSPLLILAVPLCDLLWVVFARWRSGKPFYVGDTNHLSHQLVRLGLSPVQAVLLIWGLAAFVGALALLLN